MALEGHPVLPLCLDRVATTVSGCPGPIQPGLIVFIVLIWTHTNSSAAFLFVGFLLRAPTPSLPPASILTIFRHFQWLSVQHHVGQGHFGLRWGLWGRQKEQSAKGNHVLQQHPWGSPPPVAILVSQGTVLNKPTASKFSRGIRGHTGCRNQAWICLS